MELLVFQFLKEDNAHEEEAEHTVAEVAEDVIEVSDQTQRLPAEVVVVADVLVAGDALLVGEREDHLEDGQGVEQAD